MGITLDESNADEIERLDEKLEGALHSELEREGTPQERDEHGRFTSGEPQEEPPEEAPEETPQQEERVYAGRYKTVEELERAVEEKQAYIARSDTEKGQLRQEINELRELREALSAQREQQQYQGYDWDGLIEQNPVAAAEAAYQSNNQLVLRQAMEAWNEMAPGAPQLWAENKRLERGLDELRESIGQQTTDRTLKEFSQTHPDVEQYAQEMGEIAQQYPFLRQTLASGDAQAQVEVLDFLYTKASTGRQARNAETLAAKTQEADAERQALTQQAKEQAALSSPTQASPESKPRNTGQQWLDDFRQVAFDNTTDLSSGLTRD